MSRGSRFPRIWCGETQCKAGVSPASGLFWWPSCCLPSPAMRKTTRARSLPGLAGPRRVFSQIKRRQVPPFPRSPLGVAPAASDRRASAATHSWRVSPFYHKETGAGQDLGPNSAVPSSFKQGEVGWPGGTGQAKQANGVPSGAGSGPCQLCGWGELGNAKSAAFQPPPCENINKSPHWAGRRKPQTHGLFLQGHGRGSEAHAAPPSSSQR